MKRVIKKKYILIFLFLVFFCSNVQTAEPLNNITHLLKKDQLSEFLKTMGKVCNSSYFFLNLEKHKSYPKYGRKKDWETTCAKLKKLSKKDNTLMFLKRNFRFIRIQKSPDLLTGYYEPLINISESKNSIFKFPILKKNKYYEGKSRKFIENNFNPDDVILWTDDNIDLFFLHIQGSGVGRFEDNKRIKIVYNGNNKLPYTSIGKYLIKKNYLKREDVNLFSIKKWLRNHKHLSINVMNENQRFIFFEKSNRPQESQPIGALGVPLYPNISIAVDKNFYPLGLPFLIEVENEKLIFPVVSMDTGSAIIGANRADIFTGQGNIAERNAGNLKKKIYLLCLIPYSN